MRTVLLAAFAILACSSSILAQSWRTDRAPLCFVREEDNGANNGLASWILVGDYDVPVTGGQAVCLYVLPGSTGSLTAFSDDVPNNILGDLRTPDFAASPHGTKNLTLGNARSRNPFIQGLFCPMRNRNRANVTACRSDRRWPSVPAASGYHPVPARRVRNAATHSQRAWPTSRSPF